MKLATFFCLCFSVTYFVQNGPRTLFKADRVFDGEVMHTGWSVLVNGN